MTHGRAWSREWIGGLVVLLALAHAGWLLAEQGYLPAPFMFNHDDTLMDGVNTAWWAHRPGAYEVWRSVYPPAAFAWLRIFADGACYRGDEIAARACDGRLRVALLAFFAVNVGIVGWAFRRQDRVTAVPRTLAVAAGMPMLFALERGNLVVPAFTAFALAHGGVLRGARARWITAAVAANFKPYLIAPVLAALLRRRWRWCEGALVATVLVYAAALIVTGDGTPGQLVRNTLLFASADRAGGWDTAWYASSWQPLLRYLADSPAPVTSLAGSAPIAAALFWLPMLTRASQALALAAALAIWRWPAGVPPQRAAALAMLVAVTGQEVGGYGQVFALFLLFLQPARGPWMIAAIATGYLLAMPADWTIRAFDARILEESWLGGRPVAAALGVPLGALVRPGLMLLTMDFLAIDTLRAALAGARPPSFLPQRMVVA